MTLAVSKFQSKELCLNCIEIKGPVGEANEHVTSIPVDLDHCSTCVQKNILNHQLELYT